jgi:hypothetical protein
MIFPEDREPADDEAVETRLLGSVSGSRLNMGSWVELSA